MNREEVVALMTDIINNLNRMIGQESGVPEEEIEAMIAQHQDQLNYVNLNLYENLVRFGVINESN